MKRILAIAALTATASATLIAPAAAQTRPDFLGHSIDYKAAAEAEVLATPTVNYKLSARFGQSGSNWSSGSHGGLDFAAPIGTTVMAADAGKVVEAGPGGAYGNMIEIAHGNGTRTLYAHLSDIDVRRGQTVKRGAHIGDLGNTGNSTGPHLHFEVKKNGDHVDPEKFLNL